MTTFADNGSKQTESDAKIYTVQNFVLNAGIDNYNMFKLLKFCKDSKIAQKVCQPMHECYCFY